MSDRAAGGQRAADDICGATREPARGPQRPPPAVFDSVAHMLADCPPPAAKAEKPLRGVGRGCLRENPDTSEQASSQTRCPLSA